MKWEKVKIGQITEQIRGVSYSPSDTAPEEREGYLPILRASNITEHGLDFSDFVWVKKEVIKPKQILKKGDIVIAASSGSKNLVGKAAYCNSDWNGAFGAFCKLIRPNINVESKYLAYYFQTNDYRRKISDLSAGANINNLRTEHLDELVILLPPIDTQRRIASILDKADNLRRLNKQLIAKYDELVQSVFYDMFGDPLFNIKGWKKSKLENIAETIQIGPFGTQLHKQDYIENGIPLINPMHINDLKIFGDYSFSITEEKYAELPNYHLKTGDIIMARRGEMGRCAIVTEKENGWFCGTGSLFIRSGRELCPLFLLYTLSSASAMRYLKNESKGITMDNLSKDILCKMILYLPPIDLQNKFATIVESIESQKSQAQSALARSEELFEGLLDKCFKGEVGQ